MDASALFRTLGALGLVLGLLFGALWLVRRMNLRVGGALSGSAVRRLELIERTALDPKRSVALLRRDGREHLILLAPEGHLVIESGIVPDAADRKVQARREADAAAQRREQQEALAAARTEFIRRLHTAVRAAVTQACRARVLLNRIGARHSAFARLVRYNVPPSRDAA